MKILMMILLLVSMTFAGEFAYYSTGTKWKHTTADADTVWYMSGQLLYVSVIVEPQHCDLAWFANFTSYNENGTIYLVRTTTDRCVQTEKSYDNGKLVGTTTYKNGEFVSNKCVDGRFGLETLDCRK